MSSDQFVIAHLNQFAGQLPIFDLTISHIASNHLFKGGVLMCLYWWLWFRTECTISRAKLVAGLIGACVAIVVGRLLALTLPFRYRPIHDANLDITLPGGVSPAVLDGWSSFPSDHAVLFFCLATGLLSVSRKVGLSALVYVAVCITLPRVYMGLHFLSDVLVGGAIGVTIGWTANRWLAERTEVRRLTEVAKRSPAPFYSGMFLFSFQVAEMFGSARRLVGAVAGLLQRML